MEAAGRAQERRFYKRRSEETDLEERQERQSEEMQFEEMEGRGLARTALPVPRAYRSGRNLQVKTDRCAEPLGMEHEALRIGLFYYAFCILPDSINSAFSYITFMLKI